MEAWTDKIATLALPTVVLFLAILTLARVGLRATRLAFFLFLSELLESCLLASALVFLLLRPFLVQSYHIPTVSMRPTLCEGDHILVNKLIYRQQLPRIGDAIVFRAPIEADPGEREFLKRCIGLPGDIIEVHPGYVQIGATRLSHVELRDLIEGPRSVQERAEADENLPALHLTSDAIWYGEKRIDPREFATRLGAPPTAPVTIRPGLVVRNGQVLMEDYVAEDPQYIEHPVVVPPGHLYVLGDNRNQSHDSHEWGTVSIDRVIGRADAVFWPFHRIKRIE